METLINTNFDYRKDNYEPEAVDVLMARFGLDEDEIYDNEWEWGRELDSEIDYIAMEYEGEMLNALKKWGKNVDGFLVTYSCGRWNGIYNGTEIIRNFDEVLSKCLKDSYDYTILHDKGHLEIINCHHDGTNFFNVYPITENGMYIYHDWDYNYNDVTKEDMSENDVIKMILATEIQNEVFHPSYGGALSFYH